MANRFPLVVDSVNTNIKELPSGDNLDLTGNDALFGDNDKAIFGAGSDLQIFHNGSSGVIQNDTGSLFIRASEDDKDIHLQSDDGLGGLTSYILVDGSLGSVNLNHFGSQKLTTTSTGIDVTGSVTADSATVVTSGGLSTIAIGDQAIGTYGQLLLHGGNGKYNFSLSTQYNVNNAFEITPSTAAGGTTFSTPALVVNSSGNVGIGTSSPATKLDVGGVITHDGLRNSNTGVTATSKTLTEGEFVTVTAATQTITLPASPAAGAQVHISVGDFTDTTVARNGSNIMGAAEDLTIDVANAGVILMYSGNATQGWRIF